MTSGAESDHRAEHTLKEQSRERSVNITMVLISLIVNFSQTRVTWEGGTSTKEFS